MRWSWHCTAHQIAVRARASLVPYLVYLSPRHPVHVHVTVPVPQRSGLVSLTELRLVVSSTLFSRETPLKARSLFFPSHEFRPNKLNPSIAKILLDGAHSSDPRRRSLVHPSRSSAAPDARFVLRFSVFFLPAMTIRILVNAALLAIPIAVTLGILFGLQSHRDATGQPPLFQPQPPPIPTPAPPKPPKNGVTKTRYCEKSFGITPDTTGQKYICRCRDSLFALSPGGMASWVFGQFLVWFNMGHKNGPPVLLSILFHPMLFISISANIGPTC